MSRLPLLSGNRGLTGNGPDPETPQPATRLHLLKVIQPWQTAPSAGDQCSNTRAGGGDSHSDPNEGIVRNGCTRPKGKLVFCEI